ncbi:CBS domain-containing protein [Methanobacterium paludis]|uniref:Signal transduction protein with CBS domains n=1 Tax=Methanobacterium paludis (strain DSM 25820 / JCM 18151 / SWAN1) TaxID=868131 RepID=F6D1I3_METPW|nr:CBS domain-containing protein [Methanobacterium paludis]AEG17211.1 putative signal transduction protein with CBS domains [Methanobacterium paludis]
MIKNLHAKDIMISEVHVTTPTDLVAAAKLKMMRCNVGGLPVVDKKRLLGIITHRDILLAGGEALGLKVNDLMSKDLMVVNRETQIKDITRIMADKGYQRIPVVEDGKLVGLITQSSLIRALADLDD